MTELKRGLVPGPNHEQTVYEPVVDKAGEGRPAEGKADNSGKRDDGPPPSPPRRRVLAYVLVPAVLLLALGGWWHYQTFAAASQTSDQQKDFVPEVRTAKAQRVDKPVELVLPGQTGAFDAANIFARATGYVAERRVDIGTRVKKGDLLVRITAPDLDQQLVSAQAQLGQTEAAVLQAQASLTQANASTKLADATKFRTTTLATQGWETRQNADNATSNASVQVAGVQAAQAGIAVANANLRAQQATVQRLQELTGFEQVKAPFDGVITARNVDSGDLVSADTAGGTPMFSIARTDILRISVYVPQSNAVGLHPGLAAQVRLPELPGRVFDAKVSRTADALQQSSRSLLTEVDVANPDNALRAGLYVDVTFQMPRQHPGIVVPDEALVFGANGMQVATVTQGNTVKFVPITIYRDFGTTAELREGLKGGENLVLSPPASLNEGSKVTVAKDTKPPA